MSNISYRIGPYHYAKPQDLVTREFVRGKMRRNFTVIKSTAFNANGLIGSEYNGVVVLDNNLKQVVTDRVCCGNVSAQDSVFDALSRADWQTFRTGVNKLSRLRYSLTDGDGWTPVRNAKQTRKAKTRRMRGIRIPEYTVSRSVRDWFAAHKMPPKAIAAYEESRILHGAQTAFAKAKGECAAHALEMDFDTPARADFSLGHDENRIESYWMEYRDHAITVEMIADTDSRRDWDFGEFDYVRKEEHGAGEDRRQLGRDGVIVNSSCRKGGVFYDEGGPYEAWFTQDSWPGRVARWRKAGYARDAANIMARAELQRAGDTVLSIADSGFVGYVVRVWSRDSDGDWQEIQETDSLWCIESDYFWSCLQDHGAIQNARDAIDSAIEESASAMAASIAASRPDFYPAGDGAYA